MNVTSALSAYAYQSTLTQTGSASQALTQALVAGQSQVAQTGVLLGSVDPLTALSGSDNQGLLSLAYGSAASSGNGPGAIQATLATLNGGTTSALLPSTDGLPVSAAALAPSTTAALVRYAYDQSQNPSAFAQQIATAAQQSVLTSGLNLLA